MCPPQQRNTRRVWRKPSRESLKVLRFWRFSCLWLRLVPSYSGSIWVFGCWCLVRASYTWSNPPPKVIFPCFFAKNPSILYQGIRTLKNKVYWVLPKAPRAAVMWMPSKWSLQADVRLLSACGKNVVRLIQCNFFNFFIHWIFTCFSLAAFAFELCPLCKMVALFPCSIMFQSLCCFPVSACSVVLLQDLGQQHSYRRE